MFKFFNSYNFNANKSRENIRRDKSMDYIPVIINKFLDNFPAIVGGLLALYIYIQWKKKKSQA